MKIVSKVLWGDSVKFSPNPMFFFWPQLGSLTSKLNDPVCKEI